MQILQILHCFRSHFHPEKEQEGELFALWPAQDGWKRLQKIQKEHSAILSKSYIISLGNSVLF